MCCKAQRGFFHSKDTLGYAALKGILSWASRNSKGILFCNFGLAKDIIFDNGALKISALVALGRRNFILLIFKRNW